MVRRGEALLQGILLAAFLANASWGQRDLPLTESPGTGTDDGVKVSPVESPSSPVDLVQPDLLRRDVVPPPSVKGAPISIWIEQFAADARTLQDRFRTPGDPARQEVQRLLQEQWLNRLEEVEFGALTRDQQVDYLLLKNELIHRQKMDAIEWQKQQRASTLLPYLTDLADICLTRDRVGSIDAEATAQQLERIQKEATAAIDALDDLLLSTSVGGLVPSRNAISSTRDTTPNTPGGARSPMKPQASSWNRMLRRSYRSWGGLMNGIATKSSANRSVRKRSKRNFATP
jgi:hypothetical protein